MHFHQIRRFYGEERGWSMFDASRLTPEVLEYLRCENELLARCMEQGGYTHLVEVGCGYGRYMDWALSTGCSYSGIDVVSWLIDVGQMRAAAAKIKYPGMHCAVHVHPAERLPETPDRHIWQSSESRPLVFFPFNCIGNVTQLEPVIAALQATRVDVLVSTFKTDATSTRVRKAYYGNCGFAQLDSRLMRQGLLITSEEGFHAMAYHPDFLIDSFRKDGYLIKSQAEIATIGAVYHFLFGAKETETTVPKIGLSSGDQGIPVVRLDAIVSAIMNDPLTAARDLADNEPLVLFEHLSGHCRVLSTQQLLVETDNISLRNGTFVHVLLHLPGDAGREGVGIDLVGVIACSEHRDDSGLTELTIQLHKADAKLAKFIV